MHQTWCTHYDLLYSQIISICFAPALEARYTYPCATFPCLILLTIRLPSSAEPVSSRGHEALLSHRLAGFTCGHCLVLSPAPARNPRRFLASRQGLPPPRLRLARDARKPEPHCLRRQTPSAPVHSGLQRRHGVSAGFRTWTDAVYLGWSGECGGSRLGVVGSAD